MRSLVCLAMLGAAWHVCAAWAPDCAHAQDAAAASAAQEEAERLFDEALEAFERGEHALSARLFEQVRSERGAREAAALLMEAKALYRGGRFAEAAERVRLLDEEFPESGYAEAAARLGDLAGEGLARNVALPRNLGVLLPLGAEHAPLSQEMFTGVRMAVDEHNERYPDRPVRMIFRDTQADSARAAEAADELVALGAEAIIGPLYSGEAAASAGVAERARVVLMAPLATDEGVSSGKRYVFQANPTIVMRGRLMARFAARSLRLDEFGVIAERDRDRISERMAQGFREEAAQGGRAVRYDTLLTSQADWNRLPETLPRSAVLGARAVYLPIASGESAARLDAALTSFDRMRLADEIRILGNGNWRFVPDPMRASRYAATYADDFHVADDDPAAQAFAERYRSLTGAEPEGRLAIAGYDVARFLIPLLVEDSPAPLADRVRAAPLREGLGTRIDFDGGNVNSAMFWFRYQDGAVRQLR